MTITEIQNLCPFCQVPTNATVCSREIQTAANCLTTIITLASEVETTVCRQSRYAVRAGRPAMNVKYEKEPRPTGGLRPTQLPVNLVAADRAATAFSKVTGWADKLSTENGVPRPGDVVGEHQAVTAAKFVSRFLPKMHVHPDAVLFVEEMGAASFIIHTVVDAPEQLQIAGSCECGEYLYAGIDQTMVTCRYKSCGNSYDVVQARATLVETLREFHVTAAQGALLVGYIDSRRDRTRSRKNIITWGLRDRIWSGYSETGETVYRFGDIADRVFSEMAERESK